MRERLCNNCGGKKYEIVGQNMVKCMFCGTIYVDEQASKDEDFLIARATDTLRDFQFEAAEEEFDKILSLYPKSFEAFFGRALAKNKIVLYPNRQGTIDCPCFFGEKIVSLSEDADFQKAISCAPQERVKFFNDVARKIGKIKNKYEKDVSKKIYDCILFVSGENDQTKQTFLDEILKILNKNELSFANFDDFSQNEEISFRALETAKMFLFCVLDENEILKGKNLLDRYVHKISTHKKLKSSLVLCLDEKNVNAKTLPKDLSGCLDPLDVNSVSFSRDLETRILKEYEKAKKEVAKINSISLQEEKPKKKEYLNLDNVSPVELGHYDVENLEGSSQTKKKWIFLSLKNGDFDTASELVEKELEQDPYDAELLFAQLLAEQKIHTEDEFFEKISNFSDKNKIENILRYANKNFAENFVDRWEKLVQSLGEVEFYNRYLIFLASFKTPNRENFVKSAEDMALETLDEQLIENVPKCFAPNETERFVNFYSILAQKSDDKKYFDKILEIDAGHEESNISLMLQKFRTSQDKLSYRNRDEVENVLKYLDEEARISFVSAVVDLVLPVAFMDLQEAQNQIEFYLSYIQNEEALCNLLQKTAKSFQEMKFFKVAEKYLSLAISKEKDQNRKAELYWMLIQTKSHCRSDEELIMSEIRPTDFPEWETLLQLADAAHDDIYGAVVSKNNLFTGQKVPFSPDLLDKVELKKALQDFVLRNNEILIEIEKQEGLAVHKGVQYFKSQLRPFEKYINQIDQFEDFDEYMDFVKKVFDRLDAMGLNLSSSVSVISVKERSENLSKLDLSSNSPSSRFEKVRKNIEIKQNLCKYLMIFLEFFPILFSTCLFVLSIAIPKEVYMCFPQKCLIVFMIFSICVSAGNLIYFVVKKQKLSRKKQATFLSLVGIGVLNLIIFLISFYLPSTISILNENELQTLLPNAQYSNLVLENDLDFSEKQWKSVNFYGNFDGKGHKISNLNAGFLLSNHGQVQNLALEINFNTQQEGVVGGFAYENFGDVQNCAINGELHSDFAKVVGGFVGQNSGNLTLCTSSLTISCQSQQDLTVGGLIGKNIGRANKKICQCAFVGDIYAQSVEKQILGGLVGQETGEIEFSQCFSKANIVAACQKDATIGGLVGVGESASHDNYAVGSISAKNLSGGCVGGLYGTYSNSNLYENICHSYSSFEFDADVEKGLLIGELSGRMASCFAIGEGDLCAKLLAFAGTSNCEPAEKYLPKFEFDTTLWNLAEDLPSLLWEQQ